MATVEQAHRVFSDHGALVALKAVAGKPALIQAGWDALEPEKRESIQSAFAGMEIPL
jgi:hypothetical protein